MVFLPDYRYRYYFNVVGVDRNSKDAFNFSDANLNGAGAFDFNPDLETIISFSVKEEEFNVPVCSLQVKDVNGTLSKLFYRGRQFLVKWGIDDVRQEVDGTSINFLNFFQDYNDEVTGDFQRGNLQGYVINTPQGSLADGSHIFTTQIRLGRISGNLTDSKKYDSGTLKEILTNVATSEIGINSSDVIIKLEEKEEYNFRKKKPLVRDNETATKFIRRVCIKYNLKFQYQFSGRKKFLVISNWENEFENSKDFLRRRGVKGTYHYFDYGNSQSNIISGDYSINQTGIGSNISFVVGKDGKVQSEFSPAPQETFTQLTLNQKAIEKTLEGLSQDERQKELQRIMSLSYSEFLNAINNNDKSILKYFKREPFSTAPETRGIEFNVTVVPNPLYQVGDLALVGVTDSDSNNRGDSKGYSKLPAILRSQRGNESFSYFRIAATTWTHSASGVTQEVLLKR